MKIQKKDKVKITAGKDKGREGIVERIYKKKQEVLIPSINIYKKHIKKSQEMPKGGVVELPRPIHVSKIAVICQKCKKPTRIGYKTLKGKKSRMCKKCKSVI